MCGDGQKYVDGFAVDCWGEDVAEGIAPFLVAEYDETTLVFGRVTHGVVLHLEVHLGGDYLISTACAGIDADLGEIDGVVAAHVAEHGEFGADGCEPVVPVIEGLCLVERGVGSGAGRAFGRHCDTYLAGGEGNCDGPVA